MWTGTGLMPRLLLTVTALAVSAPAAWAGRPFTAFLDGDQQVPPVESPGGGTAELFLHSDETTARVKLVVAGLENEIVAAHIHLGAPGTNGPMVFDLGDFQDSLEVDFTPIGPGLRDALLAGNLYINVHTDVHLDGEIRGQLIPQPGRSLLARLGGSQEVPPNDSGGSGVADLTLWDGESRLHLDMVVADLEGSVTASHIHRAPPGENGPVVFSLGGFEERILADFNPTPGQVQDLLAGLHYVNVHTDLFPGGEIRGQIEENTPAAVRPTLPDGLPAGARSLLRAQPNPMRDGTRIRWVRPERAVEGSGRERAAGESAVSGSGAPTAGGPPLHLEVFNPQGRRVRALPGRQDDLFSGGIWWDGRDEEGRPVTPGVYFVRFPGIGDPASIVVLR